MTRRRLQIVCSDDDDDLLHPNNHLLPPPPPPPAAEQEDEVFIDVEEDIEAEEIEIPSPHEQIPNLDSVTLDSSISSAAVPDAAAGVVSDEDFVDVSDNLSPSPEQDFPTTMGVPGAFVASSCPVNDCLRKMGCCLRREWIDSCKLGLQDTIPGFSGFDVETKSKLCFAQALFSDMNYSGAGVLPPNVQNMHLVDLAGPFVLQVDEVINISCPLKERYKGAGPGLKRCLKLSMTDGVQRVFGMEYRPIPNKTLEAQAPAGFKVVIRNVNVRHGLLMLVPEVLEVLGGSVEELEAARVRLVHEVNKPPRGKRSRTGVVPPLSVRATLAAWLQNNVSTNTVSINGAHHDPGNRTSSAFHGTASSHGNIQVADTTIRNIQAHYRTREDTEVSTTGQTHQCPTSGVSAQFSIVREAAPLSTTIDTDELRTSEVTEPSFRRESTGLSSFSTNVVENGDAEMFDLVDHPFTGANMTTRNMQAHHDIREATEVSTRRQTYPHSTGGVSAQCSIVSEATEQSTTIETVEVPTCRKATEPSSRRESTGLSSFTTNVVENQDGDMVEHPFILSGGKELPFNYLASLLARWAAVQEKEPFVRGTIKCFMTGVKGFRYQQQSTFDLRVYVDDGSLISEILIHHNVVQKLIGCSPEELCAALTASDKTRSSEMKNTLKQFQIFLINFEGTMLVEISSTSTVPVALEMSQGSTTLDALLLLQRLKPVACSRVCENDQSNVINLSP